MGKEQKVGINTNKTLTEKITPKKRNIFKCEVIIDDNGKIKVISYANRQLGMIPNFFNDALQDVVEQINHEADWKEKYIHFSYNGENYRQIDSRNICDGCIFWKNKKCVHPYKEKKGICEHKIYIKEENWNLVTDDATEEDLDKPNFNDLDVAQPYICLKCQCENRTPYIDESKYTRDGANDMDINK